MQPSTRKPAADRAVLCQRGSELAEFVPLFSELGISVEIHSGELPSPENLEGARLVIIAGQRLAEGKPPAIRRWPRTLAVVDDGSKTLAAHLNRIGVAMVIRRPIHPRALRLLLLHELYRGPERRTKKRVLIGHPIRVGVGLFKQNATLLELSRTGARIALASPSKVGTLIQFVLGKELTNSKPIKIRAKVVRSILPQNATAGGESEVGLALLDPIELARPIQAILDRFALGPATTGPVTRNTPTTPSPRDLTAPRPNLPTAATAPAPDRTPSLPAAKPASAASSPIPPPIEPRRLPPSYPHGSLSAPAPADSPPVSSLAYDTAVDPGETIETDIATEIEVLEPDFDLDFDEDGEIGEGEGDFELELDEEVPADAIDRRHSIRVPYAQRVVALDEQAARVVVGRDLCLGGMRIAASPYLAVGDVLRLALHAGSETEPLVVLAGVERDDGEEGLVLAFAALTAPQRERLEKILAASGDIQGSLDHQGDEGASLFVGELLARVTRGRNATHSRSGFTLIELMIVVAIIGLISSVAMPLFGRYQFRSKTAEVVTNLGAVHVVQEAHFSEHGEYLPANAEPAMIPGPSPVPFDIVGTGYADLGLFASGPARRPRRYRTRAARPGIRRIPPRPDRHRNPARTVRPLPDPPFDRAPKPRPFARRRLRHLGRRARRALPERDRRQARERRLQAGLCPDRAQEQVSLRPPRRPASRRARDLVREALDEDRRSRQQSAASRGRGPPPTSLVRIAQAAVAFVAIAAGGQLYLGRASGDLDTFSREQLGGVSPYLVEGHRNGKGHGHGFVGTLDNSWASLAREDRQTAAEMLVLRLREHGLEQVMIYDRDRALRIQAIGTQPVRAL